LPTNIALVPGVAIKMPSGTGTGIGLLRFRSGTAATPVNQEADRTFTVVVQF
jgi:hypothetical protein